MKNGFTIVELLAAIGIMALIIIISVPAYNGISNTIKQQNYDSKISMLEKSTLTYVNKYHKDEVFSGGENNKSICFTIKYLIDKNVFTPDNKTDDGITNSIQGGNLDGYLVATYETTTFEVNVKYKEQEDATCTNDPIYKGDSE